MFSQNNKYQLLNPESSENLTKIHTLVQNMLNLAFTDENSCSSDLETAESIRQRVLSYGPRYLVILAAAISAVDYWFGSVIAVRRYPDNFQLTHIAPPAAFLTNFFFNWITYIDWLDDTTDAGRIKKAVACLAGVATVAPYFFLGFEGELWQKLLVTISTLFNLPVFYYGTLDFYKYFHLPIVQKIRWTLRCSSGNYELASKKSHLVEHLKNQYYWLQHATEEQRREFINTFVSLERDKKLPFLINQNRDPIFDHTSQTVARRWLSEGSGVIGIGMMLQNIPHAIITAIGILSIDTVPLVPRIILAVLLAAFNLIPSIGFSFATMAGFDLLDFLAALFFVKIPQVQRILMDTMTSMAFIFGLLMVYRAIYIASGFGNDELSYESLIYLGSDKNIADFLGKIANLLGAIIFNGVLCEKLIKMMMMAWVGSVGTPEDKRQAAFEKLFSDLLEAVKILPLADIRAMQDFDEKEPSASIGYSTVYAAYFSAYTKEGNEQPHRKSTLTPL